MFSTKTRRVITAIEDNVSKVISDEQISEFIPYEIYPSFQLKELFYTEDAEQSLKTRHLDKPYDINIPKGGMRVLMLKMPTTKEMAADMAKSGEDIPSDWTKWNPHSTDTIDYIYVISGRVTCVIGEEQIHLKAGDFLTQIGAVHTWINQQDEPCIMLATIIGTAPSQNQQAMSIK